MPIVNIYDKPYVIDLVLTDSSTPNWNPIMNQNHFRVQKGTENQIEFKVRDNNRRPVNLRGKQLFVNINYPEKQTHLMKKKLEIVDTAKGVVQLVLLPHEMVEWPIGSLSFNITLETEAGHCRMLYVSESDNPNGFFLIEDGYYLGPKPTMSSRIFREKTNNHPETYGWFTDIFPGSNRAYNPASLMSAVFVTNNFSGTIKAYGSLETNVPQFTDDVWFPLEMSESGNFVHSTGTHLITLQANVEWVMFTIKSDDFYVASVDQDASLAFKLEDQITSVQFRNY